MAPDSRLMSVRVNGSTDGQTLTSGTPVALFSTRLASGVNVYPAVGVRAQYLAGPGGTFLTNMPIDQSIPPPITVVLNWDSALKK
jgi:hypothetical protein